MDATGTIKFDKFQGAGNDFIFLDGDQLGAAASRLMRPADIALMCDRRLGVGADGLVILWREAGGVSIIYYNADGHQGSLCGNATRCAVRFAKQLGLTDGGKIRIKTCVGHVWGRLDSSRDLVSISMPDVTTFKRASNLYDNMYFVDSGSPHHVEFLSENQLSQMNVLERGKKVCNAEVYKMIGGTNVNFVETVKGGDKLKIRTYERGVENETLACGTGAVAVAIANYLRKNNMFNSTELKGLNGLDYEHCHVHAQGGALEVNFRYSVDDKKFTGIKLTGPCKHVFSGNYNFVP